MIKMKSTIIGKTEIKSSIFLLLRIIAE